MPHDILSPGSTVALAFSRAVAAQGGLQLQSFTSDLDRAVLQQLPAEHLTELVLVNDLQGTLGDWDAAMEVVKGLKRLQQLRRLTLLEMIRIMQMSFSRPCLN